MGEDRSGERMRMRKERYGWREGVWLCYANWRGLAWVGEGNHYERMRKDGTGGGCG